MRAPVLQPSFPSSRRRGDPAHSFLLGGPRGEIGYLAFAVFVEDNRTFALILSIPPWDRELRAEVRARLHDRRLVLAAGGTVGAP